MEEKLTKEEIMALPASERLSYLSQLFSSGESESEDVFNEVLQSVIKEVESGEIPQEDFESAKSQINELYGMMSTDEGLAKTKKQIAGKKTARDLLGVVQSVNDIFTSKSQISQGQDAAQDSVRPSAPRRYQLDPSVSTSINESLRGIDATGIEAQINPVKQDIKDTYQAGQVANRVASAGNAGTFAALSQANANRRYRNVRDLGSLRSSIRESMMRNLNYALQNRLQERRMQQQRDLNVYGTELGQYNREQEAAGNLERAGRINMRNSILGLGQNILPFIDKGIEGKLGLRKTADNLKNSLLSKNISPTINDAPPTTLPSTDFDDSMDENQWRDMIDTNLALNPLRGLQFRR